MSTKNLGDCDGLGPELTPEQQPLPTAAEVAECDLSGRIVSVESDGFSDHIIPSWLPELCFHRKRSTVPDLVQQPSTSRDSLRRGPAVQGGGHLGADDRVERFVGDSA